MGSKVQTIKICGSQAGGLCKVVQFHLGVSAIKVATPSSFRILRVESSITTDEGPQGTCCRVCPADIRKMSGDEYVLA